MIKQRWSAMSPNTNNSLNTKRSQYMLMDIQVLVWNMYKYVYSKVIRKMAIPLLANRINNKNIYEQTITNLLRLFILLYKQLTSLSLVNNLCSSFCMYLYFIWIYCIIDIIMLFVNFFCNISSWDILAYITKKYIALIYYAKIVHLLSQFHAGKVGFSAVCQSIYS